MFLGDIEIGTLIDVRDHAVYAGGTSSRHMTMPSQGFVEFVLMEDMHLW